MKDTEITAFLDEESKDTYTYALSAGDLIKITVTVTIDYLRRGPGMVIFLTGFSNKTTTEYANSFTDAEVWFASVPGAVNFEFSVTVTCHPSGCGDPDLGDPGLRYHIVLVEEAVEPLSSGAAPSSGGSGSSDDGLPLWAQILIIIPVAIVVTICFFFYVFSCFAACGGNR
ncbi:MAG: hypothetical protein ACTSUE_11300 [Promethearchaeota archaeon]